MSKGIVLQFLKLRVFLASQVLHLGLHQELGEHFGLAEQEVKTLLASHLFVTIRASLLLEHFGQLLLLLFLLLQFLTLELGLLVSCLVQ